MAGFGNREWCDEDAFSSSIFCSFLTSFFNTCMENVILAQGKMSKRTKDGRESRLDINNSKYTIKELRVFTHE